jgi:integrase
MRYEAHGIEAKSIEETDYSVKMENLTITKSRLGRKLKKPVVLKVPEPQSAADLKLQHFVTETFLSTIPSLAQFTFENWSTMRIAKYLLFNRTASQDTLFSYIYSIYRFCKWAHTMPDQLIKKSVDKNGVPKPKALVHTKRLIEDFVAYLQTQSTSPSTIYSRVHGVVALFRINGLMLPPFGLANYYIYCDRAPSREELCKILDIANLREKVIIAMLALGGFRIGTLVKLQYRHVKTDLERHVTPIHIYVTAEITKGRYNNYYTYVNFEAAKYLTAYLNARRRGTRFIPPENIRDESPLIRCADVKEAKPISPDSVYHIVHNLYFKAGLLVKDPKNSNYDLRVHSLRKFFRTEMAARGVERDYIDFMMGHKVDTYHDIKMKGIEYLRGVYLTSGIGIQPKIRLTKIDVLKEIICAWGLKPEEILTRKALEQTQPTAIQ